MRPIVFGPALVAASAITGIVAGATGLPWLLSTALIVLGAVLLVDGLHWGRDRRVRPLRSRSDDVLENRTPQHGFRAEDERVKRVIASM